MSFLSIYHGSSDIIREPQYGGGKKYNDYGLGFYCTEHIELAKEWACTEGVIGYANKYEIETKGLSILDLTSKQYSILNWMSILLQNRIVNLNTPIEVRGRQYLIDHFNLEYSDYDIIIGHRADDSYFSFARAFLANTISIKQLNYALRLGKLGEQIVLKSEKAFEMVKFVDAVRANDADYYSKRRVRDEEAREAFIKELEKDDMNGIYMRDIIREEMRAGDARLRQELS